ncbi:hypothetical protein K438DRAFT_1981700 [Mycena galopus ATCC 62051]|nr:hypothetical protein K438DRAFT_1981700 [Mycena galopus ATCC 62051]
MDPALSFNPNPTLGALEIGSLISYMLFGVTTTQVYTYYNRFPEDSRMLKSLVAFVCVCEVVSTLGIGGNLYLITILDYAHPERVDNSNFPESISVVVLCSGITSVCVHGFFAFRIYAFKKKIHIPCIIWSMVVLLLLGRFAFVGLVLSLKRTSFEGAVNRFTANCST